MSVIKKEQGFTLVEIALVLLIVGLIVGGGLALIGTQIDSSRRANTQINLEEAKSALMGFVLVNQYLPCPDADNDGLEDRATAGPRADLCQLGSFQGAVPTGTLGDEFKDAWGNPLYYAIETNDGFTDANTPITTAALATVGNISIDDPETGNQITSEAVFVLVSFGKNGAETWASINAGACPAGGQPSGAEEQENCDSDNIYDRGRVNTESDNNFYDDQLVWMAAPLLFAKMAEGNRLQ